MTTFPASFYALTRSASSAPLAQVRQIRSTPITAVDPGNAADEPGMINRWAISQPFQAGSSMPTITIRVSTGPWPGRGGLADRVPLCRRPPRKNSRRKGEAKTSGTKTSGLDSSLHSRAVSWFTPLHYCACDIAITKVITSFRPHACLPVRAMA